MIRAKIRGDQGLGFNYYSSYEGFMFNRELTCMFESERGKKPGVNPVEANTKFKCVTFTLEVTRG